MQLLDSDGKNRVFLLLLLLFLKEILELLALKWF